MKGQMIFEFVIAAALFFGIVFYVINYLSTEMTIYSGDYYSNELESKAVQVSDLLMHNQGVWDVERFANVVGLADRWPVISNGKILMLKNHCDNSYDDLLEKLDMGMSTPYGIRYMRVMIMINRTGPVPETNILSCGYEPGSVTVAKVNRFGILDIDGSLVRLTVGVWA